MNELLEQFLSEGREALQGIADRLMALESAPSDEELMTQLFRLVHTLKGNSGLFEFPEMTRVLHAGEDLMDAVRHGRVAYSQALADRLLDAMDFVGMLCDDIEGGKLSGSEHASDAVRLAAALRALIGGVDPDAAAQAEPVAAAAQAGAEQLLRIPEAERMAAFAQAGGAPLQLVLYVPDEQCFFQGDDPLFRAMQTPGLLWGGMSAREAWPAPAELDAFRCVLDFQVLSAAPVSAIDEHYRYVPDQRQLLAVDRWALVLPAGDPNGGPVYEDFVTDALGWLDRSDRAGLGRAVASLLDLSNPALWFASALRWLQLLLADEAVPTAALRALVLSLRQMQAPDWAAVMAEAGREAAAAIAAAAPPPAAPPTAAEQALDNLLDTQREVLALPDDAQWLPGRLKAAAKVLGGCLKASGRQAEQDSLKAAVQAALDQRRAAPLAVWMDQAFPLAGGDVAVAEAPPAVQAPAMAPPPAEPPAPDDDAPAAEGGDADVKFGRRSEDQSSARSLKVDQVKIDRLMNLIGEMVVAKNAIPYLANRAESVFGVRELSREIKAQYAVINRISEEMQDAIMQVRMMPVSFVFQRFPRLVRDTSRRLGKDVQLILEGQETAADKNIIESLGDPLVHIVRNSLDHGLEMPEVRRAAGKPATGTLKIVARQESDRVVIEISDDGKGIDPAVIKQKAYQKGLIDEATLERISDQEAINLVFAPGFSTAEVISDLSGRGVGMDVVRTAIERVNGSIALDSVKGQGTRIRLSLPLSMAVTNVMTISADGQVFGVPMDVVVETVRVPSASVRRIKQTLATVLRGKVVPLRPLNSLLGLASPPLTNDNDELAVLVVRVGEDTLGLLVDDFHETADIILKPLAGVLGGLKAYAGSALMGDGSVLMVLNVKEIA
jgi:two-component system chemotaxis sensor kinase CheA